MQRRARKGFVLIVTCIVLAVLLGLAGLAIDAGRMYVIKSELQAFSDSAALSAALELDGTPGGLERARKAAAAIATGEHAMKWDLGSKEIGDFKLSFAKGDTAVDEKSWQDTPRDTPGCRFAKVVAIALVPLTFFRASTVAAAGVAGRFPGATTARLVQ